MGWALQLGIEFVLQQLSMKDRMLISLKLKFVFGSKLIPLILDYMVYRNTFPKTDDFYDNINIQLNRALIAGESVILAGDFNAKLGKDITLHDCPASRSNFQHSRSSSIFRLFLFSVSPWCKKLALLACGRFSVEHARHNT